MAQTFWQLEFFDVQPHFISFFKIHLSSRLVHKIFVLFMRVFKIGLSHLPQAPLFLSSCVTIGTSSLASLEGYSTTTQIVGMISDLPVTIWKGGHRCQML
jgi:hypothetical protein